MNSDASGCHMCPPNPPSSSHFQPSTLSSDFRLHSLGCSHVPLPHSSLCQEKKQYLRSMEVPSLLCILYISIVTSSLRSSQQTLQIPESHSGIQSAGVAVPSGLDMTTARMQSSCDHQGTLMKSGLLTLPPG